MKRRSYLILVYSILFITYQSSAQPLTRQNTLRGSMTPERVCWDLKYCDLAINFDVANKFIEGSDTISFDVILPQPIMQIDLKKPVTITKAKYRGQQLLYKHEGNVYLIRFPYHLFQEQAIS